MTTKRVIVLDEPTFRGKIKALSLPYPEILSIKKGHYPATGREMISGVNFHNYMKFTATGDRYLIADHLDAAAKYLNGFYNYVRSVRFPAP